MEEYLKTLDDNNIDDSISNKYKDSSVTLEDKKSNYLQKLLDE